MGKVVQMLEGITEIDRPPSLKVSEISLSMTSGNSSVSGASKFAASATVSSSGGSFQATKAVSSVSARDLEKTSSSLLVSDRLSA